MGGWVGDVQAGASSMNLRVSGRGRDSGHRMRVSDLAFVFIPSR